MKLRVIHLGTLTADGRPEVHHVPVVAPNPMTFREKVLKWFRGHLWHCYFCHQTFNYYPFCGAYWIYPTPEHREKDKPEWLCCECGKEYRKEMRRCDEEDFACEAGKE